MTNWGIAAIVFGLLVNLAFSLWMLRRLSGRILAVQHIAGAARTAAAVAEAKIDTLTGRVNAMEQEIEQQLHDLRDQVADMQEDLGKVAKRTDILELKDTVRAMLSEVAGRPIQSGGGTQVNVGEVSAQRDAHVGGRTNYSPPRRRRPPDDPPAQ